MELRNRIEKVEKQLTPTQKYIGEKLLEIPSTRITNMTIEQISYEISASSTSIFSFIRKLGFRNIYSFKEFLKLEQNKKSIISEEIQLTEQKLNKVNFDSIVFDIKEAKDVLIVSKGFATALSRILTRKLRKKFFNVHEINGDNGFDMINNNKKYFVIYITISGRFINDLPWQLQELLDKHPSLLITHAKPLVNSIDHFKYLIYGANLKEYPRSEFENPDNTLIITQFLINYLANRI